MILRLDANTPDSTAQFLLTETGEEVKAYHYDDYGMDNPSKTAHRLFIPIHRGCLEIADRFMARASNHISQSSTSSITTVNEFWKTLYLRINDRLQSLCPCPDEPHEYFGGRSCRRRTWDVDDVGHEYGYVSFLS